MRISKRRDASTPFRPTFARDGTPLSMTAMRRGSLAAECNEVEESRICDATGFFEPPEAAESSLYSPRGLLARRVTAIERFYAASE